jgi:hypothetical protein
MPNPSRLCACECGRPTKLASKTSRADGHVKGQPLRYLKGHNRTPQGDGRQAHPLYVIWHAMLSRCYRPKDTNYPRYGGRGIEVCERWRRSFWSFVEDVGERPSLHHTLDRQKNDQGYEPSNVRWATPLQQARNSRQNRQLTAHARTQILQEWIDESGLLKSTFKTRLRNGWTLERILCTPVRRHA